MATAGIYDYMVNIKFNATEFVAIAKDSINYEFPEPRARQWMANHWDFAVQMCGYYFMFIVLLQFFMRKREPFNLTAPMFFWNASLAAFSALGALVLAPDFFGTLFQKGFHASHCSMERYKMGTNGFVVWIMAISKLTELGDTVFLILRKKPLMFLHWYHHILTAIYAFLTYPNDSAFNRWGVYINCCVHAAMYSYYTICSLNIKLPRTVAQAVTTMQIGQLFIMAGLLSWTAFSAYVRGIPCDVHGPSLTVALLMDLSYLVLFLNFYIRAYILKKPIHGVMMGEEKVESKKKK